jgi:hypothetical protein
MGLHFGQESRKVVLMWHERPMHFDVLAGQKTLLLKRSLFELFLCWCLHSY